MHTLRLLTNTFVAQATIDVMREIGREKSENSCSMLGYPRRV